MGEQVLSLQQVVGENVKRVRGERHMLQEEVASAARNAGLKWTGVTLTQIENGNRSISAEELLLLAVILDEPLAELLHYPDADVELSETMLLPSSVLRAIVSSETRVSELQVVDESLQWRPIPNLEWELDERVLEGMWRAHLFPSLLTYLRVRDGSRGEAERKAGMQMSGTAAEMAAIALRLFGRSLTDERDVRAKEAVKEGKQLRAVRGHITRALLEEMRVDRLQATRIRQTEESRKLKPRSEVEKKLQRISIDEYKTDVKVRQRAQKLYGVWSVENILDQHDPTWRERSFPDDEEARIRQMLQEQEQWATSKTRRPHRLKIEIEAEKKERRR